jgi:ABC-type glycerol-3-phosphate transport system substrate-binding protein
MAMHKNDPAIRFPAYGSYPHGKTFPLVSGPKTGREARAFISFINSPEGRSVLTNTGSLPVRGKE